MPTCCRLMPLVATALALSAATPTLADSVLIFLTDEGGAAARIGAPVELTVDEKTATALGGIGSALRVVDLRKSLLEAVQPLAAQWDSATRGGTATIRFLVPPGGTSGTLRLQAIRGKPPERIPIVADPKRSRYEVAEKET